MASQFGGFSKSAHWVPDSGTFQAKEDGIYYGSLQIRFNDASGSYWQIALVVNGQYSDDVGIYSMQQGDSHTRFTMNAQGVFKLSKGDIVSVMIRTSGDSSYSVSQESSVSIARLLNVSHGFLVDKSS
jgi:hypothetical protein